MRRSGDLTCLPAAGTDRPPTRRAAVRGLDTGTLPGALPSSSIERDRENLCTPGHGAPLALPPRLEVCRGWGWGRGLLSHWVVTRAGCSQPPSPALTSEYPGRKVCACFLLLVACTSELQAHICPRQHEIHPGLPEGRPQLAGGSALWEQTHRTQILACRDWGRLTASPRSQVLSVSRR